MAVFLLLPGTVLAQQTGTVEGTVTDAQSEEPLPGANLRLQGTSFGAATNPDGEFEIEDVDPGDYTLVVSFVGYRTARVDLSVSAGETTTVTVPVEPDLAGLEEVVVTGLASESQRQRAAISTSRVNASELTTKNNYQSLDQLVKGNVTGVNVQQSSGNVGSGVRFRVRSGVSLNGDGQPVIYIDGVRVNNDQFEGFTAGGQGFSPLADLNPENVQSIEILKGPSATSIYGTDGADGVVLIQTKSGLSGQNLRVNYSGVFGQTERVRDYDEDQYIASDAINDLWRTGDIWQHSVSATGSFNDVNYFLSFANRREAGILRNNSGARNNFQANFEVNPTDEVRISANSAFTINELQRPDNDNNIFGQLGNTVLAPGGTPYFFTDSTSVFQIDDQSRIARFTGSLSGRYSPEAVQGLSFSATAGADLTSYRQDRLFPFTGTFTGVTNGEKNIDVQEIRQFNGDVSGRYNYIITDDLTATSIVGGQVFTESERESFSTAQNFSTGVITDIGGASDLQQIGEGFLNERSAGIFARQEFDYQETYSLALSLRRDFATALGQQVETTSIFYPSASASVLLNNFDFTPDVFELLKVRAAFGQAGSLPRASQTDPFRFRAEPSGFGAGATITSVGDVTLEPERVTEFTTGLDFDLLGRFSFEGTYYYQTTSNSIVVFPSAPSTGFRALFGGDAPPVGDGTPRNVGQIDGQGVETSLNIVALTGRSYQVDFDLNYTYQWAEAKDLGGREIAGPGDNNFVVEGLAPSSFFGFDVDGAQFDEDGEINGPNFVDQNGDGVVNTDDRVFLGNPRPDHFGGFRANVLLFNNLTVTGLAEFAAGQQVLNDTERFATRFGNNAEVANLEGRLEELEPGTEDYVNVADQLAELDGADAAFVNYLEDGDYIKIREIAIRYDFAPLLESAGLQTPLRNFSLALSGRNLFTFTNYSGPDPEVNFDGARGQVQGQDFLTLQTPRTYTVTLSVGL